MSRHDKDKPLSPTYARIMQINAFLTEYGKIIY